MSGPSERDEGLQSTDTPPHAMSHNTPIHDTERDEIAADREAQAVTEIAEVLASWCSKSGDDMSHLLCGELVHRQHREQAQALMPWLAERDRRTAAKTLREAAEARDLRLSGHSGISIRRLRDRADRIEAGHE